MIPPGAADTVHYRMHVPENAGSTIPQHARLLYRKFSWWNTQFSFAGEPDPGQPEPSMDRARGVLEKALTLKPDLARANFFYAKVLRNDGNYEDAAKRLRLVVAQYPRDRVALNDLGRILFLQRKYQDAVQQLQAVLGIDPEDLQAHYNLMLCYNGLGDPKQAHEHEVRYLRFKADESAQAITGNYRLVHPEDDNGRQAIHEHVSVKLPVGAAAKGSQKYTKLQNAAPQAAKPKDTQLRFAKPGVGN